MAYPFHCHWDPKLPWINGLLLLVHPLAPSWGNTLGTHNWVTAVAVWLLQEATFKGPTSSIEAYSCNLHILDPVGDALQVSWMTTGKWCLAQWAGPVLSLMIARMQDGSWASACWKRLIHLSSSTSFENATASSWCGPSCVGKSYQKNHKRPNFNWSCQLWIGRLLWEGVMMRSAT